MTICQWVDGQYEDMVFRGGERLVSTVVSSLELTVDQLFGLGQ